MKVRQPIEKGDYDTAVDKLLTTVNTAQDASAAEAQYLMAEILYKQENYSQAIQTLYDFNSKFSSYEFWLGKSFLLVADCYTATEEFFQAKATLNSIIENSPVEEIVEEAKLKILNINQLESAQEEEDVAEESYDLLEEEQN